MDKAVPSTTTTASPEQQPRRNLSEAFEALCTGSTIVEAPPTTTSKEDASDGLKLSSSSPTSVVEAIHAQVGEEPLKLPTIALVQDLQRDLSTECVARISIYSMIHDINKEATTLAALDPIAPPDASCKGPLLLALRGESTCPLQPSSSSQSSGTTKRKIQSSDQAIIDEEKWLLTEILSQTEAYTEEIPATFHQALGDREYQNPHRAGRTQLWKPGRSWWEAKSGKNPWIEPSLHNQRWRYLWPLIHYHKFLAKCIKKLKRNGLDVTLSPHSISIFLRQEVCAVSDHLASVSLFGSETWMQSLPQFNGWVDDRPEARMLYRRYVSHLPLRGMNDPADVDSPVLRDQVDEAFLRALTQHADRDSTVPSRRSKEDATVATESTTQQQQQGCIEDPENVPRNIRGRRYYGWYDANSVHSELSTNSYSAYDYNNCLYMHPNYYSEHNNYAPAYPWMNYYHPVYTATNYEEAVPATPTPHHSHEMPSPYWGHLEQVAAMGLATPSTPARHRSPRKSTKNILCISPPTQARAIMNITIVAAESGRSESIPVNETTRIQDLEEWAPALLEMTTPVTLWKDQKRLSSPALTLSQAGIQNGDLIMVTNQQQQASSQPQSLDFSNLLGSASSAATSGTETLGGLDFSNLLSGTPSSNPVYYAGMSLHEAQSYNRHPRAFCQVLMEHEHLRKELNYYNPVLVASMFPPGGTVDHATNIWRENMIKGGIQSALKETSQFHEEQQMKDRLAQNPNDSEAAAYFRNKDRKQRIAEQREQVYEEYPEAFASVIMLYIHAKINGHDIQAFCDSGAQSTVMSRELAVECGLEDWIDESMAGVAVGVGTRKILGRIHSVQLQIGDTYFPCTVTVLEDPPEGASKMGFLLGLDMMKRHLCIMDLKAGCLKFQVAGGKYLETPFLHEKDLDSTKGGTKGFDATKSNEELRKRMEED